MKIRPTETRGRVAVELGNRDDQLLAEAARHPLPIRTILVPIDFSEFSYKSLDYAVAFAEQSGAEIILLHVVPTTYVNSDMIGFDYTAISREAAKITKGQLERLRAKRVPGESRARIASNSSSARSNILFLITVIATIELLLQRVDVTNYNPPHFLNS